MRLALILLLVPSFAVADGVPVVQKKPGIIDPTVPEGKLKEFINPSVPKGTLREVPKPPTVALKARLIGKSTATVVLEIDGRSYIVAKGAVVSLTENRKLKVSEISATEVRLEVEPTNDTLILN